MPSSGDGHAHAHARLGPGEQAEEGREQQPGADRPEHRDRAVEPRHAAHERDGEEARERQRPVLLREPVELVEAEQGQGSHQGEEDEPAVDDDDDGEHAEDDAGDDARHHDAPPPASSGRRGAAAAEAALAAGVVGQRRVQVLRAEVRPVAVAEVQLRVGALPEQEVADAKLPGGADQELRVVHLGGVQVPPQIVVGELGAGRAACCAGRALSPDRRRVLGRQALRRVEQFAPPAVAEGDVERHLRVGGGQRLGLFDAADELIGCPFSTPDEAHARPSLVHVGHLRIYHLDEQLHQGLDLVLGTVPVLGAEGVDRDLLDAEVERVLEHAAQRPWRPPGAPRPRAGPCPAPSGRCRP